MSQPKADVQSFTAPDDFGFVKGREKPSVDGTYSRETGERMLRSLSKCRGFKRFSDTGIVMSAGFGEKGKATVEREFIYPTEYEPPVVREMEDGSGKLVEPATPIAFDTKMLGVSLEYSGKSAADGRIQFRLTLDRTTFLGFVNYGTPIVGTRKGLFGRDVKVVQSENQIEMPVFDKKAASAEIYVNDGDFIALSGFMPNDPPETKEFVAWAVTAANAPESGGGNFVALIQVRSGE